MHTYLQGSARWQLHCRKHRVSEGVILCFPVFPLVNEKPARTMQQMWDYEICVQPHPSTSGAACSVYSAHTYGWRQCAREHVCIMYLHFWAPTTSLSPSGFEPQLDVVSTLEPPQPWLHRARLNPGFRVVKNGRTLFCHFGWGPGIWGPSILDLNVRIWILKVPILWLFFWWALPNSWPPPCRTWNPWY